MEVRPNANSVLSTHAQALHEADLKTDPATDIYVETWHGKGLCGGIVAWNKTEELHPILVPFDGVEWLSLQIVVTFQPDSFPSDRVRWHHNLNGTATGNCGISECSLPGAANKENAEKESE